MTQVNLLAPEQRVVEPTESTALSTPGLLLVGALGLALVAVTLYALAIRDVRNRETQLAASTAQQQAVTTQAAAYTSYTAFAQKANERVTFVQGLATSRYPWARRLDELAQVLPADAHLSSVTLDGAAAPAAATAATTTTAAPVRTMVLQGCVERQRSIPDLLSQLTDLRGATSVDLGSSTKGEVQEGAQSQEPTLCRRADAPTFDVTVSFGADATAAAAATPAPSATGTPAP